jgi:UDP-N-acetylglucosamine 3-dehydrogenase
MGTMGRNHARVLTEIPNVEFVGVADPSLDPSQPGLAQVPRIVPTIDDLLELGIDACVIATPTEAHRPTAEALAGAGKHVLIEKPLAEDVASAEAIVTAVNDAGVVGAVGHIERFNPALQELRRRLAEGQLGNIYQIATRRQSPFPARVADVGVVFDLATHDLDLTSWVAQQAYTSVTARTAHKSGRAHEDLVAVLGQLKDGTVTNHLVNWLSPLKERVTVVTGERGCFVADTVSADLSFYANGSVEMEWEALSIFKGVSQGDVSTYAFAKPEPLRTELEAFVAASEGGDRSLLVTLEQGLHAVRVASSILESARCGETVHI